MKDYVKIGKHEKFYGTLITVGESIGITVPIEIIKVNGWKIGTDVVIWINKRK